ncbi:MAG TPA: hypothetical protein DCW90_03395 [Lachnospiraceae bacterium]|nr:hypothetical protein [Lachnospiraceae bacterium]
MKIREVSLFHDVKITFTNTFLRNFFTRYPHNITFGFRKSDDPNDWWDVDFNYVNCDFIDEEKILYLYECKNKKIVLMFVGSPKHMKSRGIQTIVRLFNGIDDKPAENYLLENIYSIGTTDKDKQMVILLDEYDKEDSSDITRFIIYDVNSLNPMLTGDGDVIYNVEDIMNREFYERNPVHFMNCVRHCAIKNKFLPDFPYLLFRGKRMQRLIRFRKF